MIMNKKITIFFTFILVVLFINKSKAQICFTSYTSDQCPYRVIGEFGVSLPIKTLTNQYPKLDFSINLGMQRKVGEGISFGIHGFSNIIFSENNNHFQAGIRPRFAYLLHPNIEVGVAPGFILSNSLSGLKNFKGYSIESNISYKNAVGLVCRMDIHNFEAQQKQTVIYLGIQTHGNTATYTFSSIALGGGLAVLLLQGLFGN